MKIFNKEKNNGLILIGMLKNYEISKSDNSIAWTFYVLMKTYFG